SPVCTSSVCRAMGSSRPAWTFVLADQALNTSTANCSSTPASAVRPRIEMQPPDDVTPGTHESFMRLALDEARQAFAEDEVPIGAVVLFEGRLIAAAHNQREQLHDPTAHAEMIAITQAAAARGDWRLDRCILYV